MQPINALAFVWDGILYGTGKFSYGAVAMGAAAVPSIALMEVGARVWAHGDPDLALVSVWLGLALLMLLRWLGLAAPYRLRAGPFKCFRGIRGDDEDVPLLLQLPDVHPVGAGGRGAEGDWHPSSSPRAASGSPV